jgi:thiol:disulfide interchange protein
MVVRLLAILLLIWAVPLAASVLVLKSGETITDVAFTVPEGARLKVVLKSGEQRQVALDQVDLNATTRANQQPATDGNGAGQVEEIAWFTSFDEARRHAARSGKRIVVMFYTDWCGYCRKMNREVFPNPAVVAQSKRFVYLRLNAEDGREGTALATRYGVNGFPSSFVMDHQGSILSVIPGFVPAQKWIELLAPHST